ncbi:hypothetical protein V1505DRAFT_359131, partial [Lipomyces doorenjongii]
MSTITRGLVIVSATGDELRTDMLIKKHEFEQRKVVANGHSNAKDIKNDEFAILSFRNLIFGLCMRNGGGHGGSAVGTDLYFQWSIFEFFSAILTWVFGMNHLVGYDVWTVDELK